MAEQTISLHYDDSEARAAVSRVNKGIESNEQTAERAGSAIARATDAQASHIVRIAEKSRLSINRTVQQAQTKLAFARAGDPVSSVPKLEAERDIGVRRVSGDLRAVEELKASYRELIEIRRKADSAATFKQTQAGLSAAAKAADDFEESLQHANRQLDQAKARRDEEVARRYELATRQAASAIRERIAAQERSAAVAQKEKRAIQEENAALERRAQLAGRSPLQKIQIEGTHAIADLRARGATDREIASRTASYQKLIQVQRQADNSALLARAQAGSLRAARASDEFTRALNQTNAAAQKNREAIEQETRALERRAQVLGRSGTQRLAAEGNRALADLATRGASVEVIRRQTAAYQQLIAAQRGLDASNQTTGQSLLALGARFGLVVGAAEALRRIISLGAEAVQYAARTEQLGVALGAVARANSVAESTTAVLTSRLKAQGIITQDARQSLVRLIAAEVDHTKAQQLARVSQDLSRVAGITTSEAFERLTHAVVTQQPELLRALGINVLFEQEFQKIAKAANRTTESLTGYERRQIALNAILREGSNFAGVYEKSLETAGGQLLSLQRYGREASDAFGQQFLPELTSVVKVLVLVGKNGEVAGEFLARAAKAAVAPFYTLRVELQNNLLPRLRDMLAPEIATGLDTFRSIVNAIKPDPATPGILRQTAEAAKALVAPFLLLGGPGMEGALAAFHTFMEVQRRALSTVTSGFSGLVDKVLPAYRENLSKINDEMLKGAAAAAQQVRSDKAREAASKTFKEQDEAAERSRIAAREAAKKQQEEMLKLEERARDFRDQAARRELTGLEAVAEKRRQLLRELGAAPKARKLIDEGTRLEELKVIVDAEKKAEAFRDQAIAKEASGIDQIREKRRQALADLGNIPSAKAVAFIDEATVALTRKHYDDLLKQAESFFATSTRREAEGFDRLAEIRREWLEKVKDNPAAIEIVNRAILASERRLTEDLAVELQKRVDQRESLSIDTERDAQLRNLQLQEAQTIQAGSSTSARLLQQKIALEQQKSEVEKDHILKRATFELQASINEEARQINAAGVGAKQKEAIALKASADRREIEQKAEAAMDAARDTATIRTAELIRDQQQRIFDSIRQSAEGLFDSMLQGAKSFGDALKRVMLAALLTPIKQAFSNAVATMLAGLKTAQSNAVSPGGTAGGLFGKIGLNTLFGGGGFSLPGAPGGTGGFAGPVRLGATAAAAVPSFAGQISSGGITASAGTSAVQTAGLAGQFAGIKQSLTQLGNIGFKAGGKGIGGAAGGGLLLGGGALAFDGLRRGGALGLAETTAGGALIGLKFGGAPGAAVGAAIGFGAGFVRLFIKGAQEKIVTKVKSIYGISITKDFARDPLLGIVKQNFGGNLEVGLRSPQVRELIELYAMSTGQERGGALAPKVQPSRFTQSAGAITQQATFSNATQVTAARTVKAALAPAATNLPEPKVDVANIERTQVKFEADRSTLADATDKRLAVTRTATIGVLEQQIEKSNGVTLRGMQAVRAGISEPDPLATVAQIETAPIVAKQKLFETARTATVEQAQERLGGTNATVLDSIQVQFENSHTSTTAGLQRLLSSIGSTGITTPTARFETDAIALAQRQFETDRASVVAEVQQKFDAGNTLAVERLKSQMADGQTNVIGGLQRAASAIGTAGIPSPGAQFEAGAIELAQKRFEAERSTTVAQAQQRFETGQIGTVERLQAQIEAARESVGGLQKVAGAIDTARVALPVNRFDTGALVTAQKQFELERASAVGQVQERFQAHEATVMGDLQSRLDTTREKAMGDVGSILSSIGSPGIADPSQRGITSVGTFENASLSLPKTVQAAPLAAAPVSAPSNLAEVSTALVESMVKAFTAQPVQFGMAQISINGDAATAALEGRIAPVVARSPEAVSTAQLRASRNSTNRRQQTALTLAPGVITG